MWVMVHLADQINHLDSVSLNRYNAETVIIGIDVPDPYSLALEAWHCHWQDGMGRWCVKVALCRLWLHLFIVHKHSGYVHCRSPEVIQKSRFVRTVSRSTCTCRLVYHACMWCMYRTCYCWHFKYPITFLDIDLNILSCLIFIHKNYVLFCRYLFIYLCECLCVSHVNSVIISFRFLWSSTLLIYYV